MTTVRNIGSVEGITIPAIVVEGSVMGFSPCPCRLGAQPCELLQRRSLQETCGSIPTLQIVPMVSPEAIPSVKYDHIYWRDPLDANLNCSRGARNKKW
jgi:hypothetical protein